MIQVIINTIISFVIGGILGYCVSLIKKYKKKYEDKTEESKLLKEAMMMLLQSNLTNTYFIYDSLKEIPDYIYKNWINSLAIYESLGGNDYVHVLADKMKNWDLIKTDILR